MTFLVVFDPATVGPGPMEMRDDLPGGASRLFAEAQGVDAVVVNGTTIVRDGKVSEEQPGTVLRSRRDTDTVRASATA